jgi:hypothetical protein
MKNILIAAALLGLTGTTHAGTYKKAFENLKNKVSPAVLDQFVPPPAPVSDVETVGPRVTMLLNAELSNQREPVWPGYSVFGQPILIYEAGVRSFLIAHPNPPAGYTPVMSSPQPVFVKQGIIPDLNYIFQFHRQINGVDSFAFRYEPGDRPDQGPRTIVHERFHVFQKTGFTDTPYAPRSSEPDGEELALAALEQKTLKRALTAGDRAGSAHYVRQFLAIRGARYARQPDSRLLENNEERREGMARYVEESLMDRADVEPVPGGAAGAIIKSLDRSPAVNNMNKWRYYGTGAAQGLLLDRAGQNEWKKRVAAGSALFDILAAAYPLLPGSEAGLVTEAKAADNYAALLQAGTQTASAYQALKSKAIAEYDNSPGIEWSFPYSSGGGGGFSSINPWYKLGNGETLMPKLQVYDISSDGYSLHFTDRPTIHGGDRGIRTHAAGSATLLLDGAPFTLADGVYQFETLSLTEAGLALSITKPGALTVTPNKAAIAFRDTMR